MKTYLTLTAGLIIAVGAGLGMWEWTRSVGREGITHMAVLKGICRPGDCASGLALATSRIARKYGMDASLTEWCIGVKELSPAKLSRKGWLKSLATEAMNIPCPTIDDHFGL